MLLLDRAPFVHRGITDQRRRHTPATGNVGDDRIPQLEELRLLGRVSFDRLQLHLAGEDGSGAALLRSAVQFSHLPAEGLDCFLRDRLLSFEDDIRAGGVVPEGGRRRVDRPGQGDRCRAQFRGSQTDEAVVGQPANVEDLRTVERGPVALRLEVLVSDRVVAHPLGPDPGRVHRPQLGAEAASAGDDPRVAVAVEGRRVDEPLVELVGTLPLIRSLGEDVGDRQVGGDRLPAVRQ